jgi:hypothetical protein
MPIPRVRWADHAARDDLAPLHHAYLHRFCTYFYTMYIVSYTRLPLTDSGGSAHEEWVEV